MAKLNNLMKLSARGTPIAILSALIDMITMYALGQFTDLDLIYRIYISSILGMFISFIGNFLWTFKNSENTASKTTKFIKYMINHIILTIIHAQIVILVIDKINKSIERATTNIFTTKDKDGKIKLNNITDIAIKQTLAGFFYFINIFIMQYIF